MSQMSTCIRIRLAHLIMVFKGLVLHPARGVKCIRKNVKPELITQHNQYVYLKKIAWRHKNNNLQSSLTYFLMYE